MQPSPRLEEGDTLESTPTPSLKVTKSLNEHTAANMLDHID